MDDVCRAAKLAIVVVPMGRLNPEDFSEIVEKICFAARVRDEGV
jgi:hypothetical protein